MVTVEFPVLQYHRNSWFKTNEQGKNKSLKKGKLKSGVWFSPPVRMDISFYGKESNLWISLQCHCYGICRTWMFSLCVSSCLTYLVAQRSLLSVPKALPCTFTLHRPRFNSSEGSTVFQGAALHTAIQNRLKITGIDYYLRWKYVWTYAMHEIERSSQKIVYIHNCVLTPPAKQLSALGSVSCGPWLFLSSSLVILVVCSLFSYVGK